MSLEKVIFGFFVLLAATLNLGFFIGDLSDPTLHNVYELFAAVVVNLIATVLKFGDRTQIGAVHLATSLVADLQLIAAALVWTYATLDDLAEICSEDIEIHPVLGDVVSADTFTGKDGIRRWRQSIFDSLGDLHVELVDVVAGGNGRYLALVRFSGHGKASGAHCADPDEKVAAAWRVGAHADLRQ